MARKSYILGSRVVLGLLGDSARRTHHHFRRPPFTGRSYPGLAATGPCILPRRARMGPKGLRPWTNWSSIPLVGADRPADGATTGRPVREEKAWRTNSTTRSA
jgi:hypothetical protein